jgi:hypothetical protein
MPTIIALPPAPSAAAAAIATTGSATTGSVAQPVAQPVVWQKGVQKKYRAMVVGKVAGGIGELRAPSVVSSAAGE